MGDSREFRRTIEARYHLFNHQSNLARGDMSHCKTIPSTMPHPANAVYRPLFFHSHTCKDANSLKIERRILLAKAIARLTLVGLIC
jgi:hypothetical protein